jgi:hypothetical protein
MSLFKLMASFSCIVLTLLLTSESATAQPAALARRGFVEGGLGLGYAMSNGQYLEVANGTQLDSPRSSGPAIDIAGGYALIPNLAVVADLQAAWSSTRESQNDKGDIESSSSSYRSIAVGLRASVPAGAGEVYAQFEIGLALPFEIERNRARSNGETRNITTGFNSGAGARGEMGYHYNINERLYILGGLRLQAFATDNVGQQQVQIEQPSGKVETRTFGLDPNANNSERASALSVQDLRLRVGVGFRL